jgi:hypothetical protein
MCIEVEGNCEIVDLKHIDKILNVLVERKCRKLYLNNISPLSPAVLDFVRDNHYIRRIEYIEN